LFLIPVVGWNKPSFYSQSIRNWRFLNSMFYSQADSFASSWWDKVIRRNSQFSWRHLWAVFASATPM